MMSLSIATPSSVTFTSKINLSKSSFNGIRIARVCPVNHARTANSMSSSSMVVKMAKREEELKEIRTKTTEELQEEIVDLKGELFMLRLQRSARNEFKSSEFLRMRKRIARMLTVKRERELEEGINKRISRKLDRKWKKSIVPRPPPSLKKLQEEEAAAEAKESA
ncbi:PREDICTED: 50S ribosomal protein L29, chloroplastic-like [Nicotiana attenuata]|uniref:Large ribosomal subunit protein uL29c n=1 Tax=Nicotiana attenuata TaxID=49451 RepID=A0A1J6J167_NICAT|nr:PREDICTED: 50S ribosomal protein L29, chloroplastic-like [Nicotiana attenuata]OIT04723.1 50s ribosomal protein l29, chloroplastic [Nicotiana attenuata]